MKVLTFQKICLPLSHWGQKWGSREGSSARRCTPLEGRRRPRKKVEALVGWVVPLAGWRRSCSPRRRLSESSEPPRTLRSRRIPRGSPYLSQPPHVISFSILLHLPNCPPRLIFKVTPRWNPAPTVQRDKFDQELGNNDRNVFTSSLPCRGEKSLSEKRLSDGWPGNWEFFENFFNESST